MSIRDRLNGNKNLYLHMWAALNCFNVQRFSPTVQSNGSVIFVTKKIGLIRHVHKHNHKHVHKHVHEKSYGLIKLVKKIQNLIKYVQWFANMFMKSPTVQSNMFTNMFTKSHTV
nr:protein [Spodoptera litura nucleopolyhedrovirus]